MTLPKEILPSCVYCGPSCRILYGTCHCGCGVATSIARTSNRKRGDKEGMPVKFLRGHASIEKRIDDSVLGSFRLYGIYCRLIALTCGIYAIVSEEEYWEYKQWNWSAKHYPKRNCYYAARHKRSSEGKRGVVYMHRQMLGLLQGDPAIADHKDNLRTTENVRANLRPADDSQTMMNQGIRADNKSGYKGVSWCEKRQKWIAQICAHKTYHFLGYFDTKEEAAEAYRRGALKYHGEFARFD